MASGPSGTGETTGSDSPRCEKPPPPALAVNIGRNFYFTEDQQLYVSMNSIT